NQKIYVGGEVGTPGLLPLVGEMTVMRAVLQAGGLKRSAKADSVLLMRRGEKGELSATKLNLRQAFKSGLGDVDLRAFDVVYVPKSRIARIDDAMSMYVKELLPLTLTGGFTYLFNNPVPGITQ